MYLDNHDNQIYCLGRGLSATTVSAPQVVPALGASVTITGTVTDQSPSGRRDINGNLDLALKDTPAISDDDMDAWMEYMFHQRPLPTNAKGVDVALRAIDPNGNLIPIGNATSDNAGNYGLPFTPEVPGTYQIIAEFKGSASMVLQAPQPSNQWAMKHQHSPYPVTVLPPTETYILASESQ
jgi:hypothetical protein